MLSVVQLFRLQFPTPPDIGGFMIIIGSRRRFFRFLQENAEILKCDEYLPKQ
jgi:hypothetical protein